MLLICFVDRGHILSRELDLLRGNIHTLEQENADLRTKVTSIQADAAEQLLKSRNRDRGRDRDMQRLAKERDDARGTHTHTHTHTHTLTHTHTHTHTLTHTHTHTRAHTHTHTRTHPHPHRACTRGRGSAREDTRRKGVCLCVPCSVDRMCSGIEVQLQKARAEKVCVCVFWLNFI